MKNGLLLTLVLSFALLVSCSRKEEPGRVTFEVPARDNSAIIDDYARTLTKGATSVMTDDDANTRAEDPAESTDHYTGTLTDARQAAQEAADDANARNEQMIRTLEEIDK